MRLDRVTRIVLNSTDPARLAQFFTGSLGFVRLPDSDGHHVALRLGPSRVDVVRGGGRPIPSDVPGWSPLFQHFAIVTRDMGAAYDRLRAGVGWRPISTAGPQHLPESSGGVTAFKFRDPDGHPLELLWFPADRVPHRWRDVDASEDVCLGVDHSAISVASTGRSTAFYADLGLRIDGSSHNHGFEQEQLDGLRGADVEVTALAFPADMPPHLELLAYRGDFDRTLPVRHADDIASTKLVLSGPNVTEQTSLRDPDGHFLQLEPLTPSAR